MRVLAWLTFALLLAGCARGARPVPADETRVRQESAARPLTLQIFQLRTDLESGQQEMAMLHREIRGAALDREERRRLEGEAAATQAAFARTLAGLTELESGGGWTELETLRRQQRRLALRVAALRVALEDATR